MIPLLRLGVRLAGGGGRSERVRAISVVVATGIGAWLLLNTFAIVAVEAALGHDLFATPEMRRLLAAVVVAITTPVLVLTATASRLSATIRDRRLASLRLLGLSPWQTRLVAATEVGTTSVLGTALGAVLFLLTRPAVSGLHVAGRDWTAGPFQPSAWAWTAVAIGVPLATATVSLIPTRGLGRGMLGSQLHDRRPSLWRLAPLATGLLVLTWLITDSGSNDATSTEITAFFVGTILTAVGVLVVVPVFVRLVADGALALTARPTVRIAARRLQSQPAGMTRVVAGLLLGLFVVAGARGVVTAWETTPQYVSADRALHGGPQLLDAFVPRQAPGDVEAALENVPGVRDVVLRRHVMTHCGGGRWGCFTGFVGTCADLIALDPTVAGCRDDTVAWIEGYVPDRLPDTEMLTWLPQRRHGDPPRLALPVPEATIRSDDATAALQAQVFIPRTTPGVDGLLRASEPAYTVLADPGSAVARGVDEAVRDLGGGVYSHASPGDYYFVAGLRALVWSIAAVILSIGLLAFAVSAIDRAISRRAEVVSLQLVGVPARTLRSTQWLESLLPLAIGLPLGIGMGWWAGSGFLAVDGQFHATPWRYAAGLAGISVLAAVAVAGVTVIAASRPIRADLIRRE